MKYWTIPNVQDDLGTFLHFRETSHVPNPERIIEACKRFLGAVGFGWAETTNASEYVHNEVLKERMYCALGFADFDQRLVVVLNSTSVQTQAINWLHECAHVYQRLSDDRLVITLVSIYGLAVIEHQAEMMAAMVIAALGGNCDASLDEYLSGWATPIPAEFTSGWVERNIQQFMHMLMV